MPTFGCRADMLPTCPQHCQPSSQACCIINAIPCLITIKSLQLNLNTKIVRCCCRWCHTSLCHLLFCRTSSSISLPQFLLGGGWIACLPFTLVCTGWLSHRILWLHLYLFLLSLRRAASFLCPPAVKPLPVVASRRHRLLRCHCLLSGDASPLICLSFPGGCRNPSRRAAATTSCPLNKPASFEDTVPSCLPLVCQLVVTLTPPPLLLLMGRLNLLQRNLCLLMPRCLLSTGASPPVCLLFADWLLC